MGKIIYRDSIGLYFVEYNNEGNPRKIYCDEQENILIYQDEKGLYFVECELNKEPNKVYCDMNGNRLEVVGNTSQITKKNTAEAVFQTKNEENSSLGLGNVSQKNIQKNLKKGKKSKGLVWFGVVIAAVVLFSGGYYGYAKYFAKPSIDLSNYEIDFSAKGNDGEGKVESKVTGIPVAGNVQFKSQEEKDLIDKLLVDPKISYSKDTGLKNGEKVEVTLNIDPEVAKENKLDIKGEFKKTYTVEGLEAKASNEKKEEKRTDNPVTKNWFASNGKIRESNDSHPDTKLSNLWNKLKGSSYKRYKGGSKFNDITLGDKVVYNSKTIDLRYIREQGNDSANIEAGELKKDAYNVVGVFSNHESGDKESKIYIVAIHNNGVNVWVTSFNKGEKPTTKDGLIEFKDANEHGLWSDISKIVEEVK